jgi:hypothetical protein
MAEAMTEDSWMYPCSCFCEASAVAAYETSRSFRSKLTKTHFDGGIKTRMCAESVPRP